MAQNLAREYYQDERQKNKKISPIWYWVIVGAVALISALAMIFI